MSEHPSSDREYRLVDSRDKRIATLESEIEVRHEQIRRVWHTLNAAPPPGWITQDMRDAIVAACKGLDPLPWADSLTTKEGKGP